MQETEEKPRDFLPRGLAEPRLGADKRGALIPFTDVHLPFRASPASPQPLLQQELRRAGRSRWTQRIGRRRKEGICINSDSSELEEPQQRAEVSSRGGPLAGEAGALAVWQAAGASC